MISNPKFIPSMLNRYWTGIAILGFLFVDCSWWANSVRVEAQDATAPTAKSDLVFAEQNGVVAVEAEHFIRQQYHDARAFHVVSSKNDPSILPDGDPPHVAGASGGAYVEVLPDTRRSDKDPLIKGTNFSDEPGKMAVLIYRVHFSTPGRYYVWARAYSTGAEDNSLHVGIDGQWPESGRRLQWCDGKNNWRWDSKQRTEKEHCGEPYKIFLDIPSIGIHEIQFSMREDGFEFDRWLMTTNKEFVRPDGTGPATIAFQGKPPESFPLVAITSEQTTAQQTTAPQTNDNRLILRAPQFALQDTGFYLDSNNWLAIDPVKNKDGKVQAAFPYPSGRYDVTLQAVGENSGQSTYQVSANDVNIGQFTCPLSTQTFEVGPQYSTTWKNIELNTGDVLTLSSQVASKGGKEFSRACIACLEFLPADEATKKATEKMLAGLNSAATKNRSNDPLVLPRKPDGIGTVTISGELKQWHKVTLTLDGPFANEMDNDPNPFTDLAMDVTFVHESGTPKYQVPGYFAADGEAANSSAQSGTKWRAHLSPDKAGGWNYKVSFRQGKNSALGENGVSFSAFDNANGTFRIGPTDKTGRDFRGQGRLEYVGKRYLQFAGNRQYFLKAGPDAPETLLGYADFDNTVSRKINVPNKKFADHIKDWNAGDPTWQNGKGKGLVGSLNYLAAKGLNAFSFLTYNAAGDGDNVWPFVDRDDKMHWDCSKLDQWGAIFDHATNKGLYLHFKLQENEMDDNRRGDQLTAGNIPESLDGGKLGLERKLYCRELIARFAHNLALNWNIGEENTQSTQEICDMVKYLHDNDPYQHNIVLHTFPNAQDKVYRPLLGDRSLLTGLSLQNSWSNAHQRTLLWINESAKAGRHWVIANDEQNPASDGVPVDPGYRGNEGLATQNGKKYSMHDVRKLCLWGTLMAGGAGVEYYFGYKHPQNDLVCEDFRSRDKSWDYCRIALDFFVQNKIPIQEMENADLLVGNPSNDNSKFCFAKPGSLYLVYLPNGGSTELDLSNASGQFSVRWFNPRQGGDLSKGNVASVSAGSKVSLGEPPEDSSEDWLIVVQ
ncbi:MAG: DUF5060 domain-containing protein [Pirellula sp.]